MTDRHDSDDGNGEGAPDSVSVIRQERFAGGPAREFLSSLAADERIFEADIAVDRAHVVMLAEQEIIEAEDAQAILPALERVESDGHGELPDGEDVHEAIETAVVDIVGPAGGRMHTARSRNDEVATCLRYSLREDVLDLAATLVEARTRLLALADEHRETIMPGYTHLQAAQPTTVGHWLCSYEGALARDTERLFDAYGRINRSPLGGAAFAGTPYDIDRERTAQLLGFDGLVENAMDAASSRDFLVETNAAVAALATTLSGLAADGIQFAHDGTIDLDDDYASTSSIMPQKKNPDTLELARARAGDAAGGVAALLTTLKGLPRAYNRDLQRASRHTFAAVDAVADASDVAVGAIVTGSWNETALEEAAGAGFSTATGLADRLAQAGVPFRTAHEIVAAAAQEMDDDQDVPSYETIESVADVHLEEVIGTSLEEVLDREAIESVLDPVVSVGSRNSRGGPAPAALEAHLDRANRTLEDDRPHLADRRSDLALAAEELEAAVTDYV